MHYSLIIFIFGLIVGSFLNCVIYRTEKEESFLRGRSYCPSCKHVLSFEDLFPVLSFLLLRGKCRYCGKAISFQYPLVEILTGLIFLLIFNFSFLSSGGQLLNLAYYWIISSLLIIIFVIDLKHYIIPDGAVFSAIFVIILYHLIKFFIFGKSYLFLISNLAFGILPSLFLLALILFSRGKWMGMGDFKLAVFMGLFLGWPNILVALFSAFFMGSLVGITLMILKKKGMKSEIPFGPFLILGTLLALFFGNGIIDWYLNPFFVKMF